MPNNDFLVWAGGANANVLTQPAYASLTNLTSGVISGKASGQQANKTWRQSSIIATMITQFIVDTLNIGVTDDGTTATIEANFIAAIKQVTQLNNTGVVPGTYGPTMALTVEADGRITGLQNANLQGTGLTPGTYVAPTITVGADGRIDGITSIAYGPLAGTNTWTAQNSFAAGLELTGLDNGGVSAGMQWRAIQGSYGAGFRNDGSNVYLLQTASGAQTGIWNSFRPFSWSLTSGAVTIDGTGAGANFGGPVTIPGTATFGLSGTMYISPNQSGNQVFSFAANNFFEFISGQGFIWNSTGRIDVGTTAGFNVSGAVNTGALTTTGNISATGSNIVAGNRLRATNGAFGSGDANAATILNDFFLAQTGNDGNCYMRFPNGFIIQAWSGVNSSGADFITFANAFPNFCLNVLAHEGAPSGWSVGGGLSPTIFGTQQLSKTSFALYIVKPAGTGSANWQFAGNITYRYIAIGV